MTFNNTTPSNFFDVSANGRASSSPFVDIFKSRDPTTSDITSETSINNYAIQQKWLNTATNTLWELKNYNSSNGVTTAHWIKLGGSNIVETLTGNNTSIQVPPTSDSSTPPNNIYVQGDGVYLTVTGNDVTNTLTISPAGGLTTLYTENTGTATPTAGNLNVLGTAPITTTGSGSTITIASNGTIATSYVEDSGSAVPTLGVLNIVGTGGIVTSGAGNTVTINGSAVVGATNINVDAHTPPGTDPVVPNGSGQITVTGAQVAAGTTTNVIRTDSLAANTVTIEVQRSQAVASSTIGDNGVCHFDSSQFSVDANGFVTATSTGLAFNYTNVTNAMSPYTVVSSDQYISVDCSGGAVQLNFPNSPTFKRAWVIKDRTGNAAVSNITLTTPGGIVTIDGLTTYTMNSNYQAINLLANSTPTYEVF